MSITVTLALAAALQASPPTPSPTADAQKPPAPKMDCRYEETTGSVLEKKVCHTPEQWRQIEADTSGVSRINSGATLQRAAPH